MKQRKNGKVLKATPQERRLIAQLTKRPVFDRLDAGELEVVESDDWSDVPELEPQPAIRVPKRLYQKIVKLSRKRRTTPDRLAARWISEGLNAR